MSIQPRPPPLLFVFDTLYSGSSQTADSILTRGEKGVLLNLWNHLADLCKEKKVSTFWQISNFAPAVSKWEFSSFILFTFYILGFVSKGPSQLQSFSCTLHNVFPCKPRLYLFFLSGECSCSSFFCIVHRWPLEN